MTGDAGDYRLIRVINGWCLRYSALQASCARLILVYRGPLSRDRETEGLCAADPAEIFDLSRGRKSGRKVCGQRLLHLNCPVSAVNSAMPNLSGGPLLLLENRRFAYIELCVFLAFEKIVIGGGFYCHFDFCLGHLSECRIIASKMEPIEFWMKSFSIYTCFWKNKHIMLLAWKIR